MHYLDQCICLHKVIVNHLNDKVIARAFVNCNNVNCLPVFIVLMLDFMESFLLLIMELFSSPSYIYMAITEIYHIEYFVNGIS